MIFQRIDGNVFSGVETCPAGMREKPEKSLRGQSTGCTLGTRFLAGKRLEGWRLAVTDRRLSFLAGKDDAFGGQTIMLVCNGDLEPI